MYTCKTPIAMLLNLVTVLCAHKSVPNQLDNWISCIWVPIRNNRNYEPTGSEALNTQMTP